MRKSGRLGSSGSRYRGRGREARPRSSVDQWSRGTIGRSGEFLESGTEGTWKSAREHEEAVRFIYGGDKWTQEQRIREEQVISQGGKVDRRGAMTPGTEARHE